MGRDKLPLVRGRAAAHPYQPRIASEFYHRPPAVLVILLLGVLGIISSPAAKPTNPPRVMTWVPPYAVDACKKRLGESFDGKGMKDGITHLGLQFWNPTKDGDVQFVTRFGLKGDAAVSKFRKWGAKHGIRVMLCIYNVQPSGWDWNLARSAFATNRTKFVKALVDETVRLNLGGVDIDFEGKAENDGSKPAFVRFIAELASRLHAKGKELTVDSFAYKWNEPNQTWWPDLLPHVDGLNVMGYAETGAECKGWRSYQFMKSAAGAHASKLLLGMPGRLNEWQHSPAMKHVQWVQHDGTVGLAIWDARLQGDAWRKRAIWEAIAGIRNGAKPKPDE